MKPQVNHIVVRVGTNGIRTRKTADGIANDIVKLCCNLKTGNNEVTVFGLI